MLQENINNIVEWTASWRMKLNIDKCKHMEIGNNIKTSSYNMSAGGNTCTIPIAKVHQERDLGIIIHDRLTFSAQANTAAKRANQIMGIIFQTFTFMDPSIFTLLYKTLVRPHLEYATTIWSHQGQIHHRKCAKKGHKMYTNL